MITNFYFDAESEHRDGNVSLHVKSVPPVDWKFIL